MVQFWGHHQLHAAGARLQPLQPLAGADHERGAAVSVIYGQAIQAPVDKPKPTPGVCRPCLCPSSWHLTGVTLCIKLVRGGCSVLCIRSGKWSAR